MTTFFGVLTVDPAQNTNQPTMRDKQFQKFVKLLKEINIRTDHV